MQRDPRERPAEREVPARQARGDLRGEPLHGRHPRCERGGEQPRGLLGPSGHSAQHGEKLVASRVDRHVGSQLRPFDEIRCGRERGCLGAEPDQPGDEVGERACAGHRVGRKLHGGIDCPGPVGEPRGAQHDFQPIAALVEAEAVGRTFRDAYCYGADDGEQPVRAAHRQLRLPALVKKRLDVAPLGISDDCSRAPGPGRTPRRIPDVRGRVGRGRPAAAPYLTAFTRARFSSSSTGGGGGADFTMPNFSYSFTSTSRSVSGCALRKSRAFSRPCPMRSPP